jgi:hypothetical protein
VLVAGAASAVPRGGFGGGDEVGHPGLVATDLVEARLDLLRRCFGLAQGALLLHLEILQPDLLARLFFTAALELVLQPDEKLALPVDLLQQVLDPLHHTLVIERELVKVLVPRHQLAERTRREKRLGREERAALVDVADSTS